MRTDQTFVLLLVILLPLTGCIDVSDNADAQEKGLHLKPRIIIISISKVSNKTLFWDC